MKIPKCQIVIELLKYNVIEGGDQRGVTVSQWGCEKREKTKEREKVRELTMRKTKGAKENIFSWTRRR